MKTRVAVVGAGYFGQFHYDAWSRMQDVEIVALAAPEGGTQTAARFAVPAVFSAAADMIEQVRPDLLDITAPPEAHLGIIRAAAPSVPWIICQKPFCGGLAGAEEAIAIAEASDARVLVHENFRFQPWYRAIKAMLDTGRLGDVWQATFRLRPGDGQGPDAYLSRQPYFQKMPRFLVHETAIHWIDTFRYLLGEITAVSADLRRLNPAIAGEDAGVVVMAFASGARALFDGNRLADHEAQNRRLTMGEMEIEGSAATLRLAGDGAIHVREHGRNDWAEHSYQWRDHLFGGDCVSATCRSCLESLRSGEPAETEAAVYIRNVEIVEAVYRSDQERRWIDVAA
ncbi:MAG: Gfo/Idh/MocA family oxidoreductase [Pseudomonadota bacterium]